MLADQQLVNAVAGQIQRSHGIGPGGQHHGQIFVRHRNRAAIRAVNHRDRATPVALPRHTPVTQAVIHLATTLARLLQPAFDSALLLEVFEENPFLSDPDTNKVRDALSSLDFLVCQDIFLNETTEFADVVLPAAAWSENDGTFTNSERRVQRVRKAVDAPGEARPDWQILCDVSTFPAATAAGSMWIRSSFRARRRCFQVTSSPAV